MAVVADLDTPELTFALRRLQLDLMALIEAAEGREPVVLDVPASRPQVRGPDLGGALNLRPVKPIALRELFGHADSARVSVSLPLPRETRRMGLVKVDMTGGHEIVMDLAVDEARVSRKETRGRIEPPIALPLGVTLRGLYLDKSGDIHVEVGGFPDINLSFWVAAVPRIPHHLDDLLDTLFPEPDQSDGHDEAEAESPPTIDLSEIKVAVRDLTVRGEEPIHLGPAGELVLIAPTRLDVDYTREYLWIRGQVACREVHLEGEGFGVAHARASGTIDVGVRLMGGHRVDVRIEDLGIGTGVVDLELEDGSSLELDGLESSGGNFHLEARDGKSGWRADLGRLHARIKRGRLLLRVGSDASWVRVLETTCQGRFSVAHNDLDLDLEVAGGIEVDRMRAHFGILDLRLSGVRASGRGRAEIGYHTGLSFRGELGVRAAMEGSSLAVAGVSAEAAVGSGLAGQVSELLIGPKGLREIAGSGQLQLVLQSGQVPLGPWALVFGDAASGWVRVDRLRYVAGAIWPTLAGHMGAYAPFRRVDLGFVGSLPSGRASLVTRISLGQRDLTAEGLQLKLVGTGVDVRTATADDRRGIAALLEESDEVDARLVAALREGRYDRLELVATLDGRIVGHLLMSALTCHATEGRLNMWALRPLSVAAELRDRGIGSRLVREAVVRARQKGPTALVVVGDPSFYEQFGFRADLAERFHSPFASPRSMVLELKPGALDAVEGRLVYPPPFEEA